MQDIPKDELDDLEEMLRDESTRNVLRELEAARTDATVHPQYRELVLAEARRRGLAKPAGPTPWPAEMPPVVRLDRELLETMLERLDRIADPGDTLEETEFHVDGVRLVPVEERDQ